MQNQYGNSLCHSPMNTVHNSVEKIEYYWVDQHGSLVTTSGGATAVGIGDTLTITAQDTDYTARQWYFKQY